MIRWVRDLEEVEGLDFAWVWPLRLYGLQAARELARSRASAEDLADAARIASTDGGARRLLRRRLLKALAARALGSAVENVRIARDEAGAPSVIAPSLAFASVASRGDWVLLAVSSTPIGVDMELDDGEAPPTNLMHPTEQAKLGCLDHLSAARQAMRLWVSKEAYAKASGQRLDRVLGETVVSTGDDGVSVLVDGVSKAEVRMLAMREIVGAAVALG